MLDLPEVRDSGDVLIQPTRARIFRALAERSKPVTTREVAVVLGLHPNGVRNHLERLRRAGLVERTLRRGVRGRPADLWQLAGRGVGGSLGPTAYRELAVWLATILPADDANLLLVEEGARAIGAQLGGEEGEAAFPDSFIALLRTLGYRPELERREGEGFTLRLCNCPYREAASHNATLVCALHRGLTVGLLAGLSRRHRLAGFEPANPAEGGCRVVVAAP